MTPRAFAALCFLALAGCDLSAMPTPSDHLRECDAYCVAHGMHVTGRFGHSGTAAYGCICAVDIPNCDAAWNRADAAADVALACNQTLAECVRRGGGNK